MASTRAANPVIHGQHIFIYSNIRTNQTVYSLYRGMNNHSSLGQLAYAGKKTIPASLRKDEWRPLATVSFPKRDPGLSTYRNLLEFRKLHEMQWKNKERRYPMLPAERQKMIMECKTVPTKKERGKIIMDQKANSVADLAAVLRFRIEAAKMKAKAPDYFLKEKQVAAAELERLEASAKEAATKEAAAKEAATKKAATKEDKEKEEAARKAAAAHLEQKKREQTLWDLAERAWSGRFKNILRKPIPKQQGRSLRAEIQRLLAATDFVRKAMGVPDQRSHVSIDWADTLDANYAKSWSQEIQHGKLQMDRRGYTAPIPAPIFFKVQKEAEVKVAPKAIAKKAAEPVEQ